MVKPRASFLAFALLAGSAAPSAPAQLIHLTITTAIDNANGIMNSSVLGTNWSPWGLEGPVQLDVYYDPNQLPVGSDGFGQPVYAGNPANNFWTFSFADGPPGYRNISITRPLTFTGGGSGIDITYQAGSDPIFNIFDAQIDFGTGNPSPTLSLPSPASGDLINSSFSMFGGQDLFGVPNENAFFNGSLDTYSADIVPDFTAVPEPSTYGACGLGLLLGAIGWRRLRQQRIATPAGAR